MQRVNPRMVARGFSETKATEQRQKATMGTIPRAVTTASAHEQGLKFSSY